MIGNNRLAKTDPLQSQGTKIKLLHVINVPQTICNIHSLVCQTKKKSIRDGHTRIHIGLYIYTCIINESHCGII